MWRQLAGVVGTNVLGKAAALVAFTLVIRSLPQADYARYTLAYTAYGLVSGFVFIAINFALVRAAGRARAAAPDARPWAVYASYGALQLIAFALCVGVVVLLGAPLATWAYGSPTHAPELQLGVLAASGIVVSNYVLYLLQADERFDAYNRQNAARHLLLLPLLGALWLLEALEWRAVMAAFALSNLLPAFAYLIHPNNRRLLTLRDRDPALMRGALHGLGWMVAYFTCTSAVDYVGSALLARAAQAQLSAEAAAVALAEYGAAVRYFHVEILLLFSINAVLLPRFARAEGGAADARAFLRRWWAVLVPGYALVALGLWLGEPIWVLANGEAYRSAYPYFAWMTLGAWAYLLFIPSLNALVRHGRYRVLSACSALVLGLNVALGLTVAAPYGAAGQAVLTAVCVPLIPALMTAVVWFTRERMDNAATAAAPEAQSELA